MSPWVQLHIRDLPRSELEALSALFFRLGATGVQEAWPAGTAPPPPQPWDPQPTPDPDPLDLIVGFPVAQRALVHASVASHGLDLTWSNPPEVDWQQHFRDAFTPIVISEHLVVAPPWDAPPNALIIDPGQGFGTGRHPTTQQALRAVDRIADTVSTALDVGTGSGVLALAAAKRGVRVVGIDVDDVAIADAKRQASRNGLIADFSTTPLEDVQGSFDLVLANLHAEVLVTLAPSLLQRTARHLVVAGILHDREGMVIEALASGMAVVQRDVEGPWVCLELQPR